MNAKTEITLTQGQQAALDGFAGFLANPEESVFVFEGYAGTGKSTLIETLLDRLPKMLTMAKLVSPRVPDYEVKLTATTNKAADNFAQITGKEVTTVQSYLGLRVQTDYQTRETKLVMGTYKEKHNTLLFIDEASYVDPALLTWIFKLMKNSKVVFIGDPAQLTPVKLNRAPVFDANFPTARLTEVVRQAAGNPILDLATKLRETVTNGQFFSFSPDGQYIRHLTRDAYDNEILKEFTRPDWRSRDSKVLAWTNRRVIEYNTAIRNHCKGSPEIQAGDYVTCNKYFMYPQSKQSIKTDETVLVNAVSDPIYQYGVKGRYYTVENRIKAFCPDRLEDKIDRIKQAKSEDDYDTLEKIDTEWIDLRAMFACTINKSQGSTYDRVYIDLDDLKRCNSGNQIARMLYVATTRARHQVFFTGDLV